MILLPYYRERSISAWISKNRRMGMASESKSWDSDNKGDKKLVVTEILASVFAKTLRTKIIRIIKLW
jgi:hypothetical protein